MAPEDVMVKASRLCKSAATRARNHAHEYAKAVLRRDAAGRGKPTDVHYALQLRDAADRLWNLTR